MANLLSWFGKTVKDVEKNVGNFIGGAERGVQRNIVNPVVRQAQQAPQQITRAVSQAPQQIARAIPVVNQAININEQLTNAYKSLPKIQQQQVNQKLQQAIPTPNQIGASIAQRVMPGLGNIQTIQAQAKKGMDTAGGKKLLQNQQYAKIAKEALKPVDYGKAINKGGKIVTDTAPIQILKQIPGVKPVSGFINQNIIQPNLTDISRLSIAGSGGQGFQNGAKGYGELVQTVANQTANVVAPGLETGLVKRLGMNALPGVVTSVGQNVAAGEKDLNKIATDAGLSGLATAAFGEALPIAGKATSGLIKEGKKVTNKVVSGLSDMNSPERVAMRKATAEGGYIGQPRNAGRFGEGKLEVPKKGLLPEPPQVTALRDQADVINQSRSKLLEQGFSEGSPQMKANNQAYADVIQQINASKQGGFIKFPGKETSSNYKKIFRGQEGDTLDFDPTRQLLTDNYGGVAFSRDKSMAEPYGTNVLERYIPEDKTLKASDIPKEQLEKLRNEWKEMAGIDDSKPFSGNDNDLFDQEAEINKIVKLAKAQGKDAVDVADIYPFVGPEAEVRVLNPSILRDAQQIADKPKRSWIPDESGHIGLPKKKELPIVGEPQVRAETPQATPDEIKISTTPQTNVKLNTKRLDIAPEEAAQIQAQTSEVVDRLSNKEVQDLATNAGIDTRSYSPEQTKKKIAEQLNLRNETAMIANKAKEARLAGDTDEAARLIREAAERGGIARSQGTDLARQLQARRIIADELATPEQRLFKLLDNAGVNPEVYSKRLATVDFDNANEVIKAYRDLVPATAGDWIDVVRYNSMLSSPLTQIVNVSSTAGNISLAPVERGITGTLDHLRSAITGGERTVASGEGRAYAGGMVKGVKQGLKDFKDTLQGLDENLNADVGQGGFVPVKAYGDSATHDILSFPGRLLGAFDNFHRAIVSSGSDAALSKRTAAGLKVGNIAAENAEEAAYRTFNGEIGKADQGYILRGIDEMTGLVMKARASKNPVVKWPAKLTLPFVRIGSNLLKQGIEYGPGGLATIPGAANKQAQLAKSIMGTAVFGAAGSLIGRNRLTWAEPTNADQKKAFKEAGMQPYSVKIGNNWVGFAKLPPIISFNFALAAALDDAVKTAKLNENGLDNVMGAVAKYGNFLADQSYVKNVGDLLAAVKGDAESVTRLVGNYPQQFIPERAFTGWLAKMSDSTQRMINTDASFADKQVETLFQQYPFLRQKTTARTDTAGNPLASQHPLLNAFSPTPVSTENAEGKLGYDVLQQRLGANRDKTALKKSGVLTEGQQKSADKKVKETEIKKTLSPAERQLYDYSNADLEAMNSESAKKVLALKGTTSSTASTDPKSKYTAAQKKYDEDKKAGKISDVKDMAEQSKLTRLRAQSAYSQDTVDLYSQSFKNIISFVNSNKNGAKLWEEVKSLDKKMTDAGYTSKLYNKNGSLKATVSKSGKKSAKAKKGKVVKLPKFNITGKAVSYKKVGAPKAKLPVSKLPKIKINKMVA